LASAPAARTVAGGIAGKAPRARAVAICRRAGGERREKNGYCICINIEDTTPSTPE